MLKLFLILFVLFSSVCRAGGNISDKEAKSIKEFIDVIKTDDPNQIANFVAYPLNRFNPVPDIKTEEEFIEKYNILFDEELKKAIINSDIEKDWSHMGWRGYMLDRGVIWLDMYSDSDEMRLIAVNYVSDKEREYGEKLLKESLEQIHPSLRILKKPVLFFETDKFIIRIDEIDKNGDSVYRYASWDKSKTTLDEPDLVLSNGIRQFSGSGGNHSYLFKNGKYVYNVGVVIVGPVGGAPMDLTVYKFENPVQDIEKISDELYMCGYDENLKCKELFFAPSVKVLMDE